MKAKKEILLLGFVIEVMFLMCLAISAFGDINVDNCRYLLYKEDPAYYYKDLSELSAMLSLKTYQGQDSIEGFMRYDLGCSDVHSNNYESGKLAYTIGRYDYDDGQKLYIIALQGSTTPYELLKDVTAGSKSNFYGYKVYDIVQDFYETVLSGLLGMCGDYIDRVLITGHSLGGAAANLLAAKFAINDQDLMNRFLQKNGMYNYPQVYCYTFGSINCIDSDYLIGNNSFACIHNVYNWLDTFSPRQYGSLLVTGMGTGVGKFGKIEPFSREYRDWFTMIDYDPMHQAIAHVNHEMDNYYDAVTKGYVMASSTLEGETDLINNYVVVACPVDIEIYKNGECVGQVINNDVRKVADNVVMWVQDTQKHILLPSKNDYTIKIAATDEGTMSIFSQNAADSGDAKIFTNIELQQGKSFTGTISENVKDIKLYVTDKDGNAVAEVLENGTEKKDNNTVTPPSKDTDSPDPVPRTIDNQPDAKVISSENDDPITIAKTPSSVKVKAKRNKVTVSWKKIKKTKKTRKILAQIKGIQVQYSTDPLFKINPVTRKVKKSKLKIVLKLKKKTTYYVRVRYVGSDGFSKWSKTKKVRTR